MIGIALGRLWGLLRAVPWQLWAALAVALTAWFWGNHRYSEGRADERAKWEAAAAKERARAEEANATASESRILDIVRNIDLERARNEAIEKAVPADSPSQAPDAANRGLGCARLKAAFTPEKLRKMPDYVRECQ